MIYTPEMVQRAETERNTTLAARKFGLGGSDWQHLLLGPWGCRYRLWLEKTGVEPDMPQRDGHPLMAGRELEAGMVSLFVSWVGMSVQTAATLDRHDARMPHFWNGLPDGIVLDGDKPVGVLEIKHTNRTTWREWVDQGLDEIKMAQIHQYMALLGLRRGWFGARCYEDLSKVRFFEVGYNEELVAKMVEASEAFWRYVENGPDPTDWKQDPKSKACSNCPFFNRCHGIVDGDPVPDGGSDLLLPNDDEGLVDDLLISLRDASDERRDANERYDRVKGALVEMAKGLLDKAGAKIGRVRMGSPMVPILFYPVRRETVDKAKLRKALGVDAETYIKATTTVQSRINMRGAE